MNNQFSARTTQQEDDILKLIEQKQKQQVESAIMAQKLWRVRVLGEVV